MQTTLRRSNVDRSAETKSKLLAAAEACLTELGYAKTTTGRVCERAQVSKGALLHHFETRCNLLSSTLENIYAELTVQFNSDIDDIQFEAERPVKLVHALWRVFDSTRMKPVIELWLASSNDEPLKERVFPVMNAFAENLYPQTLALFPALGEREGAVERLVDPLFCTLEGYALECSTFGRDSSNSNRVRTMLETWVTNTIAIETPPPTTRSER
mgnify:CR=1 FL=1